MTTIVDADLADPHHAEAVLRLLNEYAADPMGGGEPLSGFARDNLVRELAARASIRVVLAFEGDDPAGIAVCIEGFSTFSCRPLLNIHDLAVSSRFRGRGIARALIARVEQIAINLGCCKITLEVLEGNTPAQSLYQSCGFAGYQLDPGLGRAMFLQRLLT
ncbi:acetyltransferase YpeA [mine drainage metagenome]|uniref:Acetyltransferase YpeA n=1 Tax=mine drainage metagenome TaxID=410659 RepID=A0A1J5RMM0_9ZZZZ